MHLYALMLVVFSFTTGEFVISGILPDVAADLSVPISAAGLAVTAYALGMVLGGPAVTVMTWRVGRRRLIIGLIMVSVLGNLGSALSGSFGALLVARFVAGSVVATFFAVAVATAAGAAEPGREAASVAKIVLGMNLGLIVGAPLGTAIGQQLSWRVSFVAVAGTALVALILVIRFVSVMPEMPLRSAQANLRAFDQRSLFLAIALTALANVGAMMIFTYFAPLLTDLTGIGASAVPLWLLAYGIGAVLGTIAGGWLADRAAMPAQIGILIALIATFLALWYLGEVAGAALVLMALLGGLAFAQVPGQQTRVMAVAGSAATLGVAVNASSFQIAVALAGWLGGQVIDRADLTHLYLVAAALTTTALGLACHLLYRDRRVRCAVLATGGGQ